MPSIRWLHLTDLHVGMKGMGPLWPSIEDEFYRDLTIVHRQAGPFDLVLFSGDLVQSGDRQQFDKLTETLQQLWTRLAELGSNPVLLAVPGNHDLQRPNERSPEVRALLNWSHDQDLRGTLFWHETDGKPYRGVVDTAFAEYTRWIRMWRAAHPLPSWLTLSDVGLLPGEFAASIRREGLSLGIVGLNSAFLQLSNTIQQGQLALHPEQFHAICGRNPRTWTGQHHACLLMTHHPPEWLTPDALASYKESILLPQWFIGHIYGHMHEPQTVVWSVGGAPAQRRFQGASLFGQETWTNAQGSQVTRLHGYSAGRFEIDAEHRGTLRLWPRIARKQSGTGLWRLAPDHDRFYLDEQDSFIMDLGLRSAQVQSVQYKNAPTSSSGCTLVSQTEGATSKPPGVAYSSDTSIADRCSRHIRDRLMFLGPRVVDSTVVESRRRYLCKIDATSPLPASDPRLYAVDRTLPANSGARETLRDVRSTLAPWIHGEAGSGLTQHDQTLVIVGASGAGKSILLDCLEYDALLTDPKDSRSSTILPLRINAGACNISANDENTGFEQALFETLAQCSLLIHGEDPREVWRAIQSNFTPILFLDGLEALPDMRARRRLLQT